MPAPSDTSSLLIGCQRRYIAVMGDRIEQFFSPDGRLISIPARMSKRIAVLERISLSLDADTQYPEKQLNEILAGFHPDTASLRRHMIEHGILRRDETSTYWIAQREL